MKYYLDTNFLNSYQETLDRINQSYQRIFEPITEALRINQELFDNLNSSVEETVRIFSQSIGAIYEGLSVSCADQLQSMSVLSPTYAEIINNFSSIAAPLAEAFRSIDFDSFLASAQNENTTNDSEDYVITDSPVIKDIDLSDSVAIPIGHNRLKIKTDTFIALISLLFSVFAFLFQYIGTGSSQEEDRLLSEQNQFLQEQNQLTQEQNQLLQEQNKILLEILESVDTSMSSQTEFFKDMKESLQEQAALFQAHPGSSVAVQESEDSTHEANDLIQRANDPTQPITDTSHSAPSTGYDND